MNAKVAFDAQQIVFETPLYEQIEIEPSTANRFSDLFNAGVTKVDGYCVECGRESVFHSMNRFTGRECNLSDLEGIKISNFFCVRNKDHVITLVTEMSYNYENGALNLTFRKIGQSPSHADIANSGLRYLSSVLKGLDRSEVIRANGLASHGVHIGAFVYLRRVFERLILRARDRSEISLEDSDFSKMRMDEKIAALSSVLPSFLVQNKRVYSVLSKGIHELDENTCGQQYELMRMSITLMLEQEREILERKTREDQLTKLISQIDT
jgi:hypothetical protein